MRLFRRKSTLLAAIGSLLLVAGGLWWWRRSPPPPPPAPPDPLPALARPPDWSRLDAYQHSITRAEFELLLMTAFTTGEGWRESIRIDDEAARIQTGEPPPADSYRLAFRTTAAQPVPSRYWRGVAELRPAPPGKPLDQVRIAIDPGHIGGEWAVIEARNLVVGSNPPVREGDLTLAVAKLLKPRLEALGATVSMVRGTTAPLTPLRPADLLVIANQQIADGAAGSPRKLAERLFYRTAEIRARADLVNTVIKPDLVLCLHFNADAWGSPTNPILVERSHLHLLVNGGYSDDEVRLADQRFALVHKLLQGTHAEEVLVATSVAGAMAAATGLPPFTYSPGSGVVRAIPGQPYVWARNLLANRLYECPVVFLEPYVMNSRTDYARIQAGDYQGLRDFDGQPRPSIFREYADAVVTGLTWHFSTRR
ncbi:MAG: N-acetylmuramoyl-L-alanine amidase [Akkermansiaceae bacterium]|nr:N-acetylmuramoyl-L-alanine amidase [Akkermansiaceae bacterium]